MIVDVWWRVLIGERESGRKPADILVQFRIQLGFGVEPRKISDERRSGANLLNRLIVSLLL